MLKIKSNNYRLKLHFLKKEKEKREIGHQDFDQINKILLFQETSNMRPTIQLEKPDLSSLQNLISAV